MLSFLPLSKTRTYKLDSFRQYMYIVLILQYEKSPQQLPNCLKIAERSVILIVLNSVVVDISTYTASLCLTK
jgi:hypothetical protein